MTQWEQRHCLPSEDSVLNCAKRAGAKRGSEPGHDRSTEGACMGRGGVRLQEMVQSEQGFEEQLSGEKL